MMTVTGGGTSRSVRDAARQPAGNGGGIVFKQTIRFEDAKSAHEFDQHIGAFLRSIDSDNATAAACLFTASRQDGDAYVRIVQTDCADLLGRLLNYLSARDFPPATQVERRVSASTH